MRETKEKTIGVHTYRVTQLGALTGRKVFARMLKTLGPLASSGGADLSKAVGNLEEDFEYLCDTFAKTTSVSGGEFGAKAPQLDTIFDAHFVGRYEDMIAWLVFALEANFGGFFRALGKTAPDTPETTA
jgi:hypothetical protein